MALKKLDIDTSSRAFAFKTLGGFVTPTITIVKKYDVTNIIKQAKKGHKINIIMNYLIVKAAQNIPEFFYFIDAYNKELYQGDKMFVSPVTKTKNGGLAHFAFKYDDDFLTFEKNYLEAKKYCFENNTSIFVNDEIRIGTSTVTGEEVEFAAVGYSPDFTNPFVVITKFYKKFFKTYTNLTFQANHLQMDGEHALLYLKKLREEINNFKIKK